MDVGLEDEVEVELHVVLLQLVVDKVPEVEVKAVLVVLVDVEVVLGDDALVLEGDDDACSSAAPPCARCAASSWR